jgi:K(+)-stimulated pyrophosphate-energized sodium pump
MYLSLENLNLLILILASLTALTMVVIKKRWLNRQLVTDQGILLVSGHIRTATLSFIKRQYSTAGKVIFLIFLLLLFLSYKGFLTWYTPFAVLSGAFFSALSAYLGMLAAVKANAITAFATRLGINKAFKAALNGGSVMGFSVCGFGLLDLAFWYGLIKFMNPEMPVEELMGIITETIITFAFGASFMAFWARVSGGIFTKSADSAADTVGKGEYGMAEDDPRNPATIADNVGDNANDVAGMGQDLNESYVGGNAASMEAAFYSHGSFMAYFGLTVSVATLVMVPLAISAIGILASIIGLATIKVNGHGFRQLLFSVRRGVYLTSFLIALGSFLLSRYAVGNLSLFWPVVIGLLTGNGIAWVSEYYTSTNYRPVKRLAEKATGGGASVMVAGLALGKESVLVTGLVLISGMLGAFFVVGGGDYNLGIYGVSLAAVAMLSTLPITLTIDAFGPIADNAQGLLEMNRIDGERSKIGNDLDALGNTTAATGKGYAIGSAAFAAIALINALLHVIERTLVGLSDTISYVPEVDISLNNIWVVAGLILGTSVPWLFSSKLLRAVGDTAFIMIAEIHRQIKDLGILKGENPPDYQRCVDIATIAAQKHSIMPAILVIFIPMLVAIFGGPAMLIAFLLAALVSSFSQAVYMSNAGGAWDNAKKMIEGGLYGGKNSFAHLAAIIGDMVGDPFKDTAGPSLNILIKLMVTLSILMAPLTMYLHYLLFA